MSSTPKTQIVVQMPIPLRYAIEARARAENRTLAGYVRDRLVRICAQNERPDDAAPVQE
jgi:hypothetical protein